MSMQHSRNKHHVEAEDSTIIAAGGNRVMRFGSTQLPQGVNVRGLPFLHFGTIYDQPIRIDFEGSQQGLSWFVFDSVVIAAGVYGSVYNMAAPRNQDGVYVLQWPYLRVRITNTGGAATTTQKAYFVVANYRS